MRTIAMFVVIGALTAAAGAQIPDLSPKTPLLDALVHNDVAEATRLLEAGANPNEGRFVGFPPLFLAVARQDAALVRLMVARGADLDARDSSGSTALMWAAFSESGADEIVLDLLKLGADPAVRNNTGETAMTWALRRGETAAVAALRRAGGSDHDRRPAAVQKALALLQRSGAQFARVSGCSSCHHQMLPQMAIGIARTRGIEVDEPAAQAQAEAIAAQMKTVHTEALANRDRIPNVPISVGYTLVALAQARYPRDGMTDALAQVVAAWQGEDGAFHPLPAIRPPIEASTFTATALSLRALQLYGTNPDERVNRARAWLHCQTPHSTEDHAMRLLGLAWSNAPADAVRTSAKALRQLQQPDGGWAQLPSLETDAYATGQALVALHAAGHDVRGETYQRGVAYLLRTQFGDGSWLVRTRTFPVQSPRDTGFPHGKHQWISAAGTSWAAMAISLALPERTGNASTPGRELPSNAADGLR